MQSLENVIELQTEEVIAEPAIRLGFIGCGNFGHGLRQYLAERQANSVQQGLIYPLMRNQEANQPTIWKITPNIDDVFRSSNIIITEASYVQLHSLLQRIRLLISDEHLLILVNNDLSLEQVHREINEHKIIRCVASQAPSFSETLIYFTASQMVSGEDIERFKKLFQHLAVVAAIESESQLEATQAVIGMGSALGFTFIDTLAEGILKSGIPKSAGWELAARILQSVSTMFLESGKHPAVLRDETMTHAGTALDGIISMEKAGLRGSILQAIESAISKKNT